MVSFAGCRSGPRLLRLRDLQGRREARLHNLLRAGRDKGEPSRFAVCIISRHECAAAAGAALSSGRGALRLRSMSRNADCGRLVYPPRVLDSTRIRTSVQGIAPDSIAAEMAAMKAAGVHVVATADAVITAFKAHTPDVIQAWRALTAGVDGAADATDIKTSAGQVEDADAVSKRKKAQQA